MKRFYLTIILSLVMIGCVPTKVIVQNPQNFSEDYNKVWNASVDAIDSLGYVIAQKQKEEGYITTEKQHSIKYYGYYENVSVGDMLSMGNTGERIKITIRLMAVSPVQVSVKVFIERLYGYPTQFRQAESNGQLEKEIFEKITASIALK